MKPKFLFFPPPPTFHVLLFPPQTYAFLSALKHHRLLYHRFSRYNQARVPDLAYRANQGPFRTRWPGIKMCVPLHLSTQPLFTSSSVESQLSELGSIRRSLFDLEAQHERAHSHYEDEIKRIRSELVAVRQSGTAPVSLGIPGRSPRQLGAPVPFPNTPAMSEAQSSSQLLRHRALERDVSERDRSRDAAERDLDRVGDQHDAKRQKTRRNFTGS